MLERSRCRVCRTRLPEPFLDLGSMPLANAFLASPEAFSKESSYPLAVSCCPACGLMQLTCVVPKEQLYRDYPYVSSTSEGVRKYAGELADRLVRRLGLASGHLVMELGSNDGLVLKAFQARGTRTLGIEPARNIAAVARENGVETVAEFFNRETAGRLRERYCPASVLLGRHVFAHIDDWHDFMEGVDRILAPEGVLILEVPYVGHLLDRLEFDTIYHEHLSYISLIPVGILCQLHGFQMTDVEEVPLHGGSILIHIRRRGAACPTARLEAALQSERERRLSDPKTLEAFSARVFRWRQAFRDLILGLGSGKARLVGYGAAAKSSTLLNFCPEAAGRLECVLDRNPHKVGRYTPGTHLPVLSPDAWKPDGVTHMVILAWNFKEEIMAQMVPFSGRGGEFVLPIPEPTVVRCAEPV